MEELVSGVSSLIVVITPAQQHLHRLKLLFNHSLFKHPWKKIVHGPQTILVEKGPSCSQGYIF